MENWVCSLIKFPGWVPVYECPMRLVKETPEVIEAVNYYHDSEWPRGHLPNAGGLLDQPNTFLQAMRFLKRLEPMCRARMEKKNGHG